jgi:hypothetical protein
MEAHKQPFCYAADPHLLFSPLVTSVNAALQLSLPLFVTGIAGTNNKYPPLAPYNPAVFANLFN